MKGTVTLVGAGPGAVDLLTLGGKRAIESCDVIVYDRLISQEILDLIPSSVERINVGKTAGNHPIPQEKINEMLLNLALEQKNVVRLKGGDSFLFGRGGEELELLQEHNIPFEVIAGVTSPLSVGAYAGIPVTHRNFSSSVHIFTGHQKDNLPLDFDFSILTQLNGTLIFLMSVQTFPHIISNLLEKGLSPDTPVSVVENGTRGNQRRFTASAEEITTVISQENIKSPSIFYVGKVCSLNFDWFSQKPLKGKQILIPHKNPSTLSQLLQQEGASTSAFSTLNTSIIQNKIPDLSLFSTIIFSSKRGVNSFFSLLFQEGFDSRMLSQKKIAAVGEGTKNQLKKYGILADFLPSISRGRVLGMELLADTKEETFLIVEGIPSSGEIEAVFQEMNKTYEIFSCYQVSYEKEFISENLSYDLVIFTSGNSVSHFTEFHPQLTHLPCICIGETTEHRAKSMGFSCRLSKSATLESIVDAVKEYFYDS